MRIHLIVNVKPEASADDLARFVMEQRERLAEIATSAEEITISVELESYTGELTPETADTILGLLRGKLGSS